MKQQNEQNNERMRKQRSWLAAVTGLLFVAICITMAILGTRLAERATNDEEAIALVPEKISREGEENTAVEPDASAQPNESAEHLQSDAIHSATQNSNDTTTVSPHKHQSGIGFIEEVVNVPLNPSVEVYDDKTTWETATEVDIFKITYENGEAVVTVDGMGDKVIAPGTGNEYTFYLKNTGNVMLDYTLEMDAYFTPDTRPIPVEARLKGYDGSYLLGTNDSWGDVLELNAVKDQASLSVNRYAYYTLEWQWPFESGDDAYDTLLGNMAVDEDLTLTIVIRTTASGEDMTTEIHRTDRVTTGDSANLLVWAGLAAGALALVTICFVFGKKRVSKQKEQEKSNEKD